MVSLAIKINHSTILVLALLSLLEFTCGQASNKLDDISKQLSEKGLPNLNDIGQELENQGIDVSKLNNTGVDPEKVEKVLREKCEKQGAADAVDILKNQNQEIQQCVTNFINVTQLQEELEEAKKTGSMDEVFGKYCKLWPDVFACVDNVLVTVRRCLTDGEQRDFNKTLEITQELHTFMCYKDGDRLAMFVAEGGVECVSEKKDGIGECLNSTLGGKLPDPNELSVATLPILAFNNENCESFDEVHNCVRDTLETCTEKTPANIVDAFFKFLKKQMPCETPALRAVAASEQASGAHAISTSLVVAIGMAFLVKVY